MVPPEIPPLLVSPEMPFSEKGKEDESHNNRLIKKKYLHSCNISPDVLTKLQAYLAKRFDDFRGFDTASPNWTERNRISASERDATESRRLVHEIATDYFPDGIEAVEIEFLRCDKKKHCEITLKFSVFREDTYIAMELTPLAARDFWNEVSATIGEMLLPYRNHNRLVHFREGSLLRLAAGSMLIVLIVGISAQLALGDVAAHGTELVAFLLSLWWIPYAIVRSLCPYTVFKTKRNEALKDRNKKFISLIVGSFLSLIGGIALLYIKRWLGFESVPSQK